MPSKRIITKGVKALEEALSKLPQGSLSAQSRIEKEFAEEAAKKAAAYAGHTPPTDTGKKAISKAKNTLAPAQKATPPKETKAQQFIDAVNKEYAPHPFMQNQRVITEGEGENQKFAQFELKPNPLYKNAVEIDWISAYPQRSGMGTKAIKELQQRAQDAGVTLTLYPWDKGQVSQRALTNFYKGLGFKPASKGSKSLSWTPIEATEAAAVPIVKPVEAPAVVIPSKVSNVEEAIRQSKGEYGARRVQRAADEVKNLEQQYTEQALRQAFGGDNAVALMIGNPADFQRYARLLPDPHRPAVDRYKGLMSAGGEGAQDVPFLQLNKEEMRLPYVSGHEGRHRNLALEELGDENTLWRMLPRSNLREPFPRRSQEEYLQALTERLGEAPLVIPEDRFLIGDKTVTGMTQDEAVKAGLYKERDWTEALKLPPLFAEGGVAHMAEGGQEFPLKWSPDANLHKGRTGVWTDTNDVFTGAMSGLMNTLAGGLRGRVIGTAGIPGDIIEGMSDIGDALPKMERKPKGQTFPVTYKAPAPFKLPTMEDLDTMLPSAGDSQEAKVAQQLGEFMPISGSEVAPAGRAFVSGAKKAGTALAPTVADMMESELRKYGMISDIIKPKGGNWMPDSPEQMTRNLKKSTIHTMTGQSPSEALADIEKIWPKETSDAVDLSFRQEVEEAFPSLKRDAAIEKWVDQKLNKYIKNEMGTESDPIRLGIERRYAEAQELRKANQKRLDKMANDIEAARAEGKSTARSERRLELAKEQFAEEEDIAFNGLYHGTIPEGGWQNFESWYENPIKLKRALYGMPTENLGTHPASKHWESTVDDEIGSYLGSDLKAPHLKDTLLIKENPWLANLAHDARVHKIDSMDTNLEFRHMIDELKAALDPTSNLPKHLKITPKDLEKMTVDDVSALSGKINGWRNVQKTKTNLEVANNPATHTFKEYPEEINPNGVSWKQIKLPEGLPEEEGKKLVRDATRYEGDLMDHCVDTHCDRLLAGQTELYSLRDVKGRPHVTIEVEPQELKLNVDTSRYLNNEQLSRLNELVKSRGGDDILYHVADARTTDVSAKQKATIANEAFKDFVKQEGINIPTARILEIKGRNNRKPKPEYMPFVQDFIRSGNWSGVGDMHHTDLRQSLDVLTTEEIKALREKGIDVPKYITAEEGINLQESIWPGSVDKYFGGADQYKNKWGQENYRYAEGGEVHEADDESTDWIDHLKNQLAGGGQPEANDSDWIDHLRSQVSAEVKKEMGNDKNNYRLEVDALPLSEPRGFSPRFQGFGFPTSVDIHRPQPIVEGAHVRGMVDVPMDRATLSLGASSNIINTPEALLFTPHSRHMEARMPVGKGNLTFSGMQNPKFGQKDLHLMYEQQFAAGGLAK